LTNNGGAGAARQASQPLPSGKTIYKLQPGESKDYTVRYEKLIKEEQDRQKNKHSGKQAYEDCDTETESDRQSLAPDFIDQEDKEAERRGEAYRDNFVRKRAEKVGIFINRKNKVQQVDLDELSFDNPYVHFITKEDPST